MKYDKFIVECLIDDVNVSKGHRYKVFQEDDKNYWIEENKHGASSFYPKTWFAKIVEEKKELNIIKASNMPIGTKFQIIHPNGYVENLKCKVSEGGSCNILAWIHNDESIGGTQNLINAKFIPIKEKIVKFDEAISSGKQIKVEHYLLRKNMEFKNYMDFNVMCRLLYNLDNIDLTEIINKGTWSIKEC